MVIVKLAVEVLEDVGVGLQRLEMGEIRCVVRRRHEANMGICSDPRECHKNHFILQIRPAPWTFVCTNDDALESHTLALVERDGERKFAKEADLFDLLES